VSNFGKGKMIRGEGEASWSNSRGRDVDGVGGRRVRIGFELVEGKSSLIPLMSSRRISARASSESCARESTFLSILRQWS
jgi:hypothetical protein